MVGSVEPIKRLAYQPIAWMLLVVLLVLPRPAWAQRQITLDEVQDIAIEQDRVIAALRAQIDAITANAPRLEKRIQDLDASQLNQLSLSVRQNSVLLTSDPNSGALTAGNAQVLIESKYKPAPGLPTFSVSSIGGGGARLGIEWRLNEPDPNATQKADLEKAKSDVENLIAQVEEKIAQREYAVQDLAQKTFHEWIRARKDYAVAYSKLQRQQQLTTYAQLNYRSGRGSLDQVTTAKKTSGDVDVELLAATQRLESAQSILTLLLGEKGDLIRDSGTVDSPEPAPLPDSASSVSNAGSVSQSRGLSWPLLQPR